MRDKSWSPEKAALKMIQRVVDSVAARLNSRKGPGDVLKFKVSGKYELECVGPDGRVKDRRVINNLVVNAGLNWIREFAFDSVTPTAIARMGWIAVGTGTTAVSAAQTALVTELVREAVDTYTAGGTGVCVISNTFAAGVAAGAVTEAGTFNAAAAGTMWNRVKFDPINVGGGDVLKVTVTITFTAT